MPMGSRQNNDILWLSMDVWKDGVFFNEQSFPAGYFAAAAMDVSDDDMIELIKADVALFDLMVEWCECDPGEDKKLHAKIWDAALKLLDELWKIPPYSYMDRSGEDGALRQALAEDSKVDITLIGSTAYYFFTRYISRLCSLPYGIYHFNIAGWYLAENYLCRLKKRNEDHFVTAVNECFNSEEYKKYMEEMAGTPIEQFSLRPNIDSSYVFARNPNPKKKEMVFVNRLFFYRAVDFYTYDLLNGMSWGHGPSRCENCGKYFLTTNAHTPRYCDGISPQDNKYTCRQYGALRNQKDKNENIPVYQIFKTRTNTIRKNHERGKISDGLRAAALEAAERHRDHALMNPDYAAAGYEQDMTLEAIYKETQETLEKKQRKGKRDTGGER